MKLKDKVAIVTGSTSGIGRAVAILFASEGAKVTVTGRNAQRLAEVQKTIKASGGQCIGVQADLTKLPEIQKVVDATVKQFGKLDILVNCHGVYELGDFFKVSEEFYDRMMNTNLKGTFFMCQAAAKEMVKQGKGKIINYSSVAGGTFGLATGTVYCASKGSIVSFTEALALELAPSKINVNAFSPGNIRSPMNEHLLADPEYLKMMLDMTPLGRIGETKDVTYATLFMASDESDYMTGHQMVIDGGMSAGPNTAAG